ncbi:SGNH/GDSL hydrolase family protein [Neorhizobium sp. P12A]|nr:SGNH/GDSL hydrolase family protein [Neorhizobium sp. P12A]
MKCLYSRRHFNRALLSSAIASVSGTAGFLSFAEHAGAAETDNRGKVVRGLGQGMHATTQTYNTSAAWSSLVRTGHRSKTRAFSRSKIVIPTFILENKLLSVTSLRAEGDIGTLKVASTSGLVEGQQIEIFGASPAEYNGTALTIHIVDATTITYLMRKAPASSPATGKISAQTREFMEVDLPHAYRFQVALEVSYVDALAGLTTRRLPYLFSGERTALYNGPGSNPSGSIVSDWLDHPEIPADAKFGLWTVTENQLGPASPAGTLPVSWNTCSFINRHEGIVENSRGPDTNISFIDVDAAVSRTSVNPFNSGQGGGTQGFWPCQMLIEYDPGDKAVAIWGDSIGDGVGEGSIGSGSHGDAMGSNRRNRGYVERAVDETLGLNIAANLSKGGDGYKYLSLTGNIGKRLNLLALANPTHIWWQMVHNDVYLDDAQFRSDAAKVFQQVRPILPDVVHVHSLCTPDASSSLPVSSLTADGTTVTVRISDTSVLIDGQNVTMSGVSPRDYAGTFPIRIIDPTTFTYSLAEIPSAPPAGTRIVCNGQFTTETQQTAGLAFGDATSSRGRKNEIIRTRTAPFDIMSRIFDPNPTAEGGYSGASASETSRWKADGTPWRYTFDGTHPNSHGYSSIAASVPDDFIQ